jgi:hypothetical protein
MLNVGVWGASFREAIGRAALREHQSINHRTFTGTAAMYCASLKPRRFLFARSLLPVCSVPRSK